MEEESHGLKAGLQAPLFQGMPCLVCVHLSIGIVSASVAEAVQFGVFTGKTVAIFAVLFLLITEMGTLFLFIYLFSPTKECDASIKYTLK